MDSAEIQYRSATPLINQPIAIQMMNMRISRYKWPEMGLNKGLKAYLLDFPALSTV